MIKEIREIEEISGASSPLFPRIFSAYKYKSGSDNAWMQIDESENEIAIISSVDNNFTLIATEKTDFTEIKEFLRFQQFNSILSNVPFCENEKSYSLFKFSNVPSIKGEYCFKFLNNASAMSEYRAFHSVLFIDEENSFDTWYPSFSKRIVNNDAKAVALTEHNVIISIATAPMFYKDTAIISGVFTLKGFRNNGYSKPTIYKLVEELKKDGVKNIYLWCEKDVEEFYKKIGFEKVGSVYIETEF